MSLRDGSIIEFKDKKTVTSVVCLKVDAKNVRVLNTSSKEFNLPLNKVNHITTHLINVSQAKFEIIANLNKFIERIDSKLDEVSLADLWELLKDEEEKKYSLKELAEIYFGTLSDSDPSSIVFRALVEDSTYFDDKGEGLYIPKAEKIVEQIIKQKRLEEEKQKQKENTIKWLKDVLDSDKKILERPEGSERVIDILEDVAVLETKSEKYNECANILHEIGIKDSNIQESAINILTKIGVFEEDQNLLLLEYHTPIKFSTSVLEETNNLNTDITSEYSKRTDLRDIYTITIDDEDTKDIDDAISLKELENGFQVGIHIADPSHFIEVDSLLDKEAYNRATTLYLPEKKIEMFPQKLSEDIFSLVEGKDRLALSILVNFDNNYNLTTYEIVESVIKVDKKLSYKEADENCSTDELLIKLLKTTQYLKDLRLSRGAVIFNLPELKIKVTEDKKIILSKYKQDSQTQQLISELMILSNSLVGEYCFKNKIPCIYRSQEEPSEIIDLSSNPNVIISMYRQRRFMKKSEVSLIPSSHYGLGLKFYTQSTSPIRRYSDLVIHRQIKYFLNNNTSLYTEEQIREVINFSEHSLYVSNLIQRNANRYWLCKYLSNQVGKKTKALVLDVTDDKYQVLVHDLCIEVPFPKDFGYKFEAGQEIEVTIKDIHIRRGSIYIRPIKENKTDVEVLNLNLV